MKLRSKIESFTKTARSEYFNYMKLHTECALRVVQLERTTFRVGAGNGSVGGSYMTIAQGWHMRGACLGRLHVIRVPARLVQYAYGRYVQGRDFNRI